jgi:hypothetical protein
MRVKAKIKHKHHTLPVGASIQTIDWHLRNLWNEGYKTIIMLTPREHVEHHKKYGFEKFSDFKDKE